MIFTHGELKLAQALPDHDEFTEEDVVRLYAVERRSVKSIATTFAQSLKYIRDVLKKHGVAIRTTGGTCLAAKAKAGATRPAAPIPQDTRFLFEFKNAMSKCRLELGQKGFVIDTVIFLEGCASSLGFDSFYLMRLDERDGLGLGRVACHPTNAPHTRLTKLLIEKEDMSKEDATFLGNMGRVAIHMAIGDFYLGYTHGC
ncbi:MAG: hypothetical protein COA47_10340 [Robiginitomaculum sp.]|nr:MAG: hypothetical protein COA47_10340 [Robiginitomaculum sp.]